MQAVHVLRDEMEIAERAFPFRRVPGAPDSAWRRRQLAPPLIPFPNQAGIAPERARGGQFLGTNFAQSPVCASRKVGTPLSAETPAPVSTPTLLAAASRCRISSGIVMTGFLRPLETANNDDYFQSSGHTQESAGWPTVVTKQKPYGVRRQAKQHREAVHLLSVLTRPRFGRRWQWILRIQSAVAASLCRRTP